MNRVKVMVGGEPRWLTVPVLREGVQAIRLAPHIVLAPAIALSVTLLADLFGRRRLFVIGIVLFTIASAACGIAGDPLFLIVARGLQGIGGATMFATALALLSQEFHGKERGTAFGIWGATIGLAVAIGPLVGGMLTSWLSWRWIFLVNIPIGIGAVVLAIVQLDGHAVGYGTPGPLARRMDALYQQYKVEVMRA